MKKTLLLLICFFLMILSCQPEPEIEEISEEAILRAKKEKPKKPSPAPEVLSNLDTDALEENIFRENLGDLFVPSALEDEACLPSEITPILLQHLAKLVSDPLAEENFNRYSHLSRQLAVTDISVQYFGEEGEYTNLVNRRIRELERFWNMPGRLRVMGQHNENLNDREKLATMFYLLMQDESSWEMAYDAADEILALNAQSPNLPESIFFSLDGFLNFNNTIIIGDGLIQLISEMGIDPEVIYSAILAHEWAHQIQLDHFETWYPGQEPNGPGTPSLQLELEADFFAAYYLAHKRGATYNWKRVEDFLDLSFSLGDCFNTNPTHHGTPAQRMRASLFGYELANSTQKKGHILSPQEVHQAFMLSLLQILN